MESSIYWIGVTHSTAISTVFIGTGFSVTPYLLATNGHVIEALADWSISLEKAGLSPLWVAIRARTFAFAGGGTHFFGPGAFYGRDYDGTVSSADVAVSIISENSPPFPTSIPIAFREDILLLSGGDAVATLGFPGELEQETQDAALQPIPTFKDGTISALRPYWTTTPSWTMTNKIVQHNLDLTPGTSGSPILNQRGQVVAVNNAGITGTDLDFAIRGDELRDILEAGKAEFPSLHENIRFKRTQLQRGQDTRSIVGLVGNRVHRRSQMELRKWLQEHGWGGM